MLNKNGLDLLNTTGFMVYGKATGECEEQHHEKWVNIDTCSFGITNQIKTPYMDNKNSKGDFSSVNVTRVFDDNSVGFMAAATYKYVGDCTIHFSKIGDDYDNPLVEVELSDAQILSYHTELTTKGMIEHFSFHFSKIKVTYFPTNVEGKNMPRSDFGCDLNSD